MKQLRSYRLWKDTDLSGSVGRALIHVPKNSRYVAITYALNEIRIWFIVPEESRAEESRTFHLVSEGQVMAWDFAVEMVGSFTTPTFGDLYLVLEQIPAKLTQKEECNADSVCHP